MEALGAFVVATAIGLYVGAAYHRAKRSRRDYRTSFKATGTYRATMRREQWRAVKIVGLFALIMLAMFMSIMKIGQQ
jgi:hypothetical protein